MSELRVVDVDPSDPDGFRPFHEVYTAALRHGPVGEFATVWQLDEVRASMADPDERIFRIGWTGWVDGRAVATGWMSGSTVDNTDLANMLVCCSPAERGQGYAAEMLAHVEEQARARGRDRLVSEVVWPYAGGAVGTGSTDLAWAERQGFELALVDVQRRLRAAGPHRAAGRAGRRRGRPPRRLRAALVLRSGARRSPGRLGCAQRQPHDRGADG